MESLLWNYITENHTENLNSTENPWKSMKLHWNFNTKIHWKNTENHTENMSLLFKYWSLHLANHTEKYFAVLQCNHVENHLGRLRWISVLIIGKRLYTENALKYLWKFSVLLNSFVLAIFMDFQSH